MIVRRAVGLERAPVAVGRRDQVVVGIALGLADRKLERGRHRRQVVRCPKSVRFALVRLDRLDLRDRAVLHFEPQHVHRLRAVGVLDHDLGARVAALRVHDVEAIRDRVGAIPERVRELLLGAVLGDPRFRRLRELARVVRDQRCVVRVDDRGEARAIARGRRRGSRGLRARAADRECAERERGGEAERGECAPARRRFESSHVFPRAVVRRDVLFHRRGLLQERGSTVRWV